ncbi:MAG TPA: flagellar hook-length control protein FliK [Nocardioides sp.]
MTVLAVPPPPLPALLPAAALPTGLPGAPVDPATVATAPCGFTTLLAAVVVPDPQVPLATHHDPGAVGDAPLVVVSHPQVPQATHHDPEGMEEAAETEEASDTDVALAPPYLVAPWLLALRLPGASTGPVVDDPAPASWPQRDGIRGAEATTPEVPAAPAGTAIDTPASWPQRDGIRGAEATTAGVALQVVERVADVTARLATSGSGTKRITLQLAPEALGEVRIVLTARDGGLQVSLSGGPEARAALQRDGSLLHRMLGDTGASVTRVVLRDPATGAVTATLPAPPSPAPASTPGTPGTPNPGPQLLSPAPAVPMGSLPPLAPTDPTASAAALLAGADGGSGSATHPGGGQHQQDRSARTHAGRPATDGDHLVGADAPAFRARPTTAARSGVDVTV